MNGPSERELKWLIRGLLLLVMFFLIFSMIGLYRIVEPLLP